MLKGVSSRREERHSIWNLRQRGEEGPIRGEGVDSHFLELGHIPSFRCNTACSLTPALCSDILNFLRHNFPELSNG